MTPKIARELGYTNSPSREEITWDDKGVIIMGPLSTEMRSYHQGLSSKEAWKAQRQAMKEARL